MWRRSFLQHYLVLNEFYRELYKGESFSRFESKGSRKEGIRKGGKRKECVVDNGFLHK